MSSFSQFCDMIDSYGGRDKVMKTLCYTAKFVSGMSETTNPDMAKKMAIISSKISGARTTLRLIDDIPMLRYSMEYGFGGKESDTTISVIAVVANIVDHIFYPIEKICWLAEHNVITVKNPNFWDTLSSTFWMTSIYLNLMRTIRSISLFEKHKRCIDRLETDAMTSLAKLSFNEKLEMISMIRLTIDFIHAGSTLPHGYLWGGKLTTWQVGMLGTMSALVGIYQYYAKKRMAK